MKENAKKSLTKIAQKDATYLAQPNALVEGFIVGAVIADTYILLKINQ